MDFDTLLAESVKLAAQPKQRKKKVTTDTVVKPRKAPLQPVAGAWENQAITCILSTTKCRNCHDTYHRPEPTYFIRKTRKRKNANPDVHYERTTIIAVHNVYSNLVREVVQFTQDIDYCHHCFITPTKTTQLPLDLELIPSPEVVDIIETLRKPA